jgi:hypothetical protein
VTDERAKRLGVRQLRFRQPRHSPARTVVFVRKRQRAGFWSLFAVQTPGAPLLSLERIGDAVRVFWPKPATGFVLDQNLTVTGVWSQVSLPYATHISITVPLPVENKFYRLRSP